MSFSNSSHIRSFIPFLKQWELSGLKVAKMKLKNNFTNKKLMIKFWENMLKHSLRKLGIWLVACLDLIKIMVTPIYLRFQKIRSSLRKFCTWEYISSFQKEIDQIVNFLNQLCLVLKITHRFLNSWIKIALAPLWVNGWNFLTNLIYQISKSEMIWSISFLITFKKFNLRFRITSIYSNLKNFF